MLLHWSGPACVAVSVSITTGLGLVLLTCYMFQQVLVRLCLAGLTRRSSDMCSSSSLRLLKVDSSRRMLLSAVSRV